MKSIGEFSNSNIKVVFTDIDGTLTQDGRIPASSYAALWDLHNAGIHVVPVTGRPAGWCEMIARTWPVHSVIGENGGFYFSMRDEMIRVFAVHSQSESSSQTQLQLAQIRERILREVPGSKVSSDQFSRLLDLAIDFAEDVDPPLPTESIDKIVSIFTQHGATAKVSDIHVNGWFGNYDKRFMVELFLKNEFPKWTASKIQQTCAFVGDSPNDEPLFGFFRESIAVRNILKFQGSLKVQPNFVADFDEAKGFCQIAQRILTESDKKT